jgi:hypothetical protein
MLAEAREVERTAGARDADDNRDTRIPDGEQVRVPAIWLTELYTPTTLAGLAERLPSVMARTRDQHPERGDIVAWVQDARRRGGGAWRMLPNVTSADAGIRTTDWIVDNLPEPVTSVTWGIYALTSTVTAVTALFRLKDDHPAGLQRIIDQDVSTRATITPQGGFTVSDVRWQKQQAADKWREELRAGASAWLADRLPGSSIAFALVNFPPSNCSPPNVSCRGTSAKPGRSREEAGRSFWTWKASTGTGSAPPFPGSGSGNADLTAGAAAPGTC